MTAVKALCEDGAQMPVISKVFDLPAMSGDKGIWPLFGQLEMGFEQD
jgi:hypothetical protein